MNEYQFEIPMDVLNASAIVHNYGNWLENPTSARDWTDKDIIAAIKVISDYKDGAIANPQEVRCEHGGHYGSASWLPGLEFVTPSGCCKARIIGDKATEASNGTD